MRDCSVIQSSENGNRNGFESSEIDNCLCVELSEIRDYPSVAHQKSVSEWFDTWKLSASSTIRHVFGPNFVPLLGIGVNGFWTNIIKLSLMMNPFGNGQRSSINCLRDIFPLLVSDERLCVSFVSLPFESISHSFWMLIDVIITFGSSTHFHQRHNPEPFRLLSL
jgi:hypothetical protein